MKWLEPMEPISKSTVIQKEDWIHQVKWDGIRGLCYIEKNQYNLYTKKGNQRTNFYPELREILKIFNGSDGILDGEIVVMDEGRPSFYRSLIRERVRNLKGISRYETKYPAQYILFDILYWNGKDLRELPTFERKNRLEKVINKTETITITDDFPDGKSLFQLMKEKNFEGIVSKNNNSPYFPGKKHADWYKTKIYKQMLVTVGGLNWKEGMPNSILLGVYENRELRYIGNASSGLKAKDFILLKEYTKEFQQGQSPFSNLKVSRNSTWFTPRLTCWVRFLEWTEDGRLRHPQIIGFSDQEPEEAEGKEYTYENND